MTPYYEDDSCTIYHGDCREIAPGLQAEVVVTDPPYGIHLNTDYSKLNGSTRVYAGVHGDDVPFDPSFMLRWRTLAFGADHYSHRLPPGGTWHVWDKRDASASNMFADCEMIWTSWKSGPSRILRYQWLCGVHPGERQDRTEHPTAKPVALMRAAVAMTHGTLLDPYMGSGTTLRAAKDLGRRAIGIEIEEKYCEIAARRLGQEVLAL